MIGQTLGSYRIVEQIGMGGMATVFKAYDPSTDRYVAVKILPEHYAHDSKFRARFQREARAIARLEHPAVLPIFAYGEEENTAYLVMRYLPSGTLKERILQGPIPLAEASALLNQVASALDYAHERKIIHRDIKPSNIMLDEKGNAYLSDFGIAKMVEATIELTGGGLLGTPAYMSPEQCQGSKDLTPASDQYALGVVLYEMLTGRTPYQAETPLAIITMQVTGAPLPLPRTIRPDLSEEIEGIILKALAKKPEDRFRSCREMAQALQQAIGQMVFEAPTRPSTPTRPDARTFDETAPRPSPRRLPIWAVAALGVLAVLIAGGGVALVLPRLRAPIPTPGTVDMNTPDAALLTQQSPSEDSSSAVGPERAFADPILTAIANTPPDYEDNFDDPESGWGGQIGGWNDGEVGYLPDTGEFFARLPEAVGQENVCASSDDGRMPVPSAIDFVMEFRARFEEAAEDSKLIVEFRTIGGVYSMWVDIASDSASLLTLLDKPTGEPRSLGSYRMGPGLMAGEWFTVQIIARDNTIALFVDSRPAIFSQIPDYDPDMRGDSVSFNFCSHGQSPVEGRWDYLRIWDISDLPPAAPVAPTVRSAEAEAFAAPILAAIAGQAPDYEDNFEDAASGTMPTGPLTHTTGGAGEAGYRAGEYVMTLMTTGNCVETQPQTLGGGSDTVMEIDGWFADVEKAFWSLTLRGGTTANGSGRWYHVGVSTDGSVVFEKSDIITGGGTLLAKTESLPFDTVYEPTHLLLVAVGDTFAVYMNDVPVLFAVDPLFSAEDGEGSMRLGLCNYGDTPVEMHWDNLKIWDISDLAIPWTQGQDSPLPVTRPLDRQGCGQGTQ